MAKQGAADVANFFSSFIEGYTTGRGLKTAEEDRQRKIEREDFVFNQAIEEKERKDKFAKDLQEAYDIMAHSDKHKQEYLQTLGSTGGINVPSSAEGSFKIPEPVNLLSDPGYLKFTSKKLKGRLGGLLASNPNYDPKTIQDYINTSDIERSSRILTTLSSNLFSNASAEEKAAGIQSSLRAMSNDKDLTVEVRPFIEEQQNGEQKTVDKFVIINSDGTEQVRSANDLRNLTDVVGLIRSADEDFQNYLGTARAEDQFRRQEKEADIGTETKKSSLELLNNQIDKIETENIFLADEIKAKINKLEAETDSGVFKAKASALSKFVTTTQNGLKNVTDALSSTTKGSGSTLFAELNLTDDQKETLNETKFNTKTIESSFQNIANLMFNNETELQEMLIDSQTGTTDKIAAAEEFELSAIKQPSFELRLKSLAINSAFANNEEDFIRKITGNEGDEITFENIGDRNYLRIKDPMQDYFIRYDYLQQIYKQGVNLRNNLGKN